MKTLTIAAASITTTFASGTLTSNNTNVSDGATVTIDTTVYTFKTTMTPTEGQVKIGTNALGSLLNLIHAINHSGLPGTEYSVEEAHTTVRATEVVANPTTNPAMTVTALSAGTAGNAIATGETAAGAVLAWGAGYLGSGSDTVTITGALSSATYTQPAQQTTIGEYPTTNNSWSRMMVMTSSGLFATRNGANSLAIPISTLSAIASAIEPTLTWVPKITTQPSQLAAVATADSAKVVFTVVAVSESAATYQWQYDPSTGVWANATGTINGCAYTNDTTASLSVDASTTGQTALNHRCVVKNSSGTTISSSAVLTIT